MADNVLIDEGSTVAIATKDVSSVEYQRVLVYPELVRAQDATSSLTTASTNYTAGDQVGTLQSVASVFRSGFLYGVILGVVLVDEGDVCPTTAGYDIYLWYSDPTLASDNAAGPAISDADSALLVAKIEMPAFRDEGSNRVSALHSISVPVVSSDTALRYSYVTRGDHNFFAANDDLNVTFIVQQG